MADYEPIIARAIAKLAENTRAERDLIYERAQAVLIAELKKRNPSISNAELARERAALDDAIRRIESTYENAAFLDFIKCSIGFAAGFALVLAVEVMLFGGMEYLSGHHMRPIGLGWIAMPVAAGVGGWRLFREINFGEVARSVAKGVMAELGAPNSKQTAAVAIIGALGWVVGTLTGFFINLAEGASYHSRTLGMWLFGDWNWSSYSGFKMYYFPWASIGWGIAGVVFVVAVVYARRLLSEK